MKQMIRWIGTAGVVAAVTAVPGRVLADRFMQHWERSLKSLEETKFTQAKAIEVAEAQTKGKAVSTHNVVLKNTLAIWVHCYADDKCLIVPVDPKSGKAAESWVGVPADLSCSTAAEATKLMAESKASLTKAIETAEAHTKGKAFSSKTDVKDGALTITIGCGVEGKAKVVTIDGKTGQVTKTEDSNYVSPPPP